MRRRAARSTPVTSPSRTRTLRARRRIQRIGAPISAGDRPAVATWYSNGWKTWWLRRSTSVTRTGLPRRVWAALSPPNPPPTITTCGVVTRTLRAPGSRLQARTYRNKVGRADEGESFRNVVSRRLHGLPARLSRLLQPGRHRPGRQGDPDRRFAGEPGDGRLHLREGPPVSRARLRRRSPAVPGGAEGAERKSALRARLVGAGTRPHYGADSGHQGAVGR